MNEQFKSALPVALSITGTAGVVATSVLVAKNAEKVNPKLREARTKKEWVKTFLKGYWPALVSGAATVASIVSGTIISKKIEASLTATSMLLNRALYKYKGKLKQTFGEKADEIVKSISKDDYKELDPSKIKLRYGQSLYHEEHVGFFKAYPEDIYKILSEMNETFILDRSNFYSLKSFLKNIKAEVIDTNVDELSYNYGWNGDYITDTYEGFGGAFVHVNIVPMGTKDDDVCYYEMIFDKEPIVSCKLKDAGDYDIMNDIEFYQQQDEDLTGILYDELKDMKPVKERKNNG